MQQKTTKRLYLTLLILFALASLFDAIGGLTQQEAGVEVMKHLGYPAYMMVILGVAKILGLIVILLPGYNTIKEWAFAGFAFNFIGAFTSRVIVGDAFFETIFPLIMLAILLLIYFAGKKIALQKTNINPVI